MGIHFSMLRPGQAVADGSWRERLHAMVKLTKMGSRLFVKPMQKPQLTLIKVAGLSDQMTELKGL
jgi:hypothetical protein